jgi:hypothetical protein
MKSPHPLPYYTGVEPLLPFDVLELVSPDYVDLYLVRIASSCIVVLDGQYGACVGNLFLMTSSFFLLRSITFVETITSHNRTAIVTSLLYRT